MIGLIAHVGGLCTKGNDSWMAFMLDLRRGSCVLVCAPPCVDSKRLRVCCQYVRVSCDTGVLLAHTEAF